MAIIGSNASRADGKGLKMSDFVPETGQNQGLLFTDQITEQIYKSFILNELT
jgi:hypothetical protein